MRRRHLLSCVALLLASAACAAPPAADATPGAATVPDPAAIRATIEATEKQWSDAYRRGDTAALGALYTEDAASIPPSGEWQRGREAVAKQSLSDHDSVTIETREDVTEEVTVTGDYAVEVGHFAWTGKAKNGGAARGASGRYMVLWRKDADGTWRLYRDLGATAPAMN